MIEINAPFNEDQVKSINEFQMAGFFHEFTCICDVLQDQHILIAKSDGMHCPYCGQVQTWVYDVMANWSWKNIGKFLYD